MKKICLFLFTTVVLYAQDYPVDYFRSPLDIPLSVSGTFGELRNNHFHSGIDFRTQMKEGLPVYATADGYVSRIKISTFGYGKAIYITHPNGYTTVYGHLQKAQGEIEDYIKKHHYEKESYEIEMFPTIFELPVKKGDLIGLSGNSGGSGGPHLHYEFRNTQTEHIINPLFFGLDKAVKDTRAPVVNGLMVYPLGEKTVVNQSEKPVIVSLSLQKDGSYLASRIVANGEIGFGLNTHDLSVNNYGKNGVYAISVHVNGKKNFEIKFDTFSFDETRHINNYIDFEQFKRTGNRFQKLFYKKSYDLSLVNKSSNSGVVSVLPNVVQNCKIEISDYHGNKTVVNIPVQYVNQEAKILNKEKQTPYKIMSDNDHNFAKENVSIYIREKTFYNDGAIDFEINGDVVSIGDKYIPIQKNIVISIEKSVENPEKYFIGMIEGNKINYIKTSFKNKKFSASSRNLGDFKLVKDSVSPKITPIQFQAGKWMSTQKYLEFSISDDLSGIASYNAYLNNQWILMEYDYKTKKLTHDFDDGIVKEGKNDLKLIVVDNVGNSTIFESHFFRSQKK
ncbi:MAG: M23 family metallopeptidase [Flavobacteriaceae bacterium]|jgi:hypothetical protein|nr:M23 family metallopeptidase [Flavobacteriaceae bacterium]